MIELQNCAVAVSVGREPARTCSTIARARVDLLERDERVGIARVGAPHRLDEAEANRLGLRRRKGHDGRCDRSRRPHFHVPGPLSARGRVGQAAVLR